MSATLRCAGPCDVLLPSNRFRNIHKEKSMSLFKIQAIHSRTLCGAAPTIYINAISGPGSEPCITYRPHR